MKGSSFGGWGRSSALYKESEKLSDRFAIKISGID